MLSLKKNITITGTSKINGDTVERYTASIDSDTPTKMSKRFFTVDEDLYKANLTECRADRAEFEDAIYALQKELTKEETES